MAGNFELTALSGINAASNGLSVVSNNIANSQTNGFKGGTAQFADLFTGSQNQPGSGTRTSAIVTDYSQGTINPTNNDLDLAVNGLGMFILDDPSDRFDQVYTRNGSFKLDKDGFVVSQEGYPLLGFNKDPALSQGATPVFSTNLTTLNIGDLNKLPRATSEINIDMNIDSSRPANQDQTNRLLQDMDVGTGGSPTFTAGSNLADKTTVAEALRAGAYGGSPDFSTNKIVHDSLGGEHRLTFDYYKVRVNGTPGTETQTTDWHVHMEMQDYDTNLGEWVRSGVSLLDDNGATVAYDTAGGGAANNSSIDFALRFSSRGQLVGVATGNVDGTTPDANFNASVQDITFALNNPQSGALDPLGSDSAGVPARLGMAVDFGEITQYAGTFNIRGIEQDGYSIGDLVGVSISGDGVIEARYSNGRAEPVAKVPLATFDDLQSLHQMGGQMYAETYASGPYLLGEAETAGFGSILSGSLEFSNVDVTAELVRMISLQRAYQASAQVISTSQTLSQTILQL